MTVQTTIKGRLLWVDDEIDLLRSHIMMLTEKGYQVETATNGEDAVDMVRKQAYDLVFLDEIMAGMGGLRTLSIIKELRPEVPVVMITKNEDEGLMEDAIGVKISDYLTKPVNPSQVLMACKKFLEKKRITGAQVSRDYTREFSEIAARLSGSSTWIDWIDIYSSLTQWTLEMDQHPDLGLKQTLSDQIRECNVEFSKYVERNYRDWIAGKNRPPISVDVLDKYLLPHVSEGKKVVLFVIDCLRLDQWVEMEALLRELYDVRRDYHFSILPTATPYSRNSIFSGIFPDEIETRFPEIWSAWEDDDNSRNRFEHQFMDAWLERRKVKLATETRYLKILDADFGRGVENNILTYANSSLTAIVVNFVDMLAHGRSDSSLLREIAPDESAYRSLTRSWFLHSSLYGMFRALSKRKDVTIVVTTDHGSIRSMRAVKVIGDREASPNLRYKYGRNLKVDERNAIFIKNPRDFRLPTRSVTLNYIVAKEDFYFVYPTEFHRYVKQYRDSFQHGGVSMEEMILPVATLTPKQ